MSNTDYDVDALCAEMKAARAAVVAAMRAVPRSRWRKKGRSGWTPANIAAHLVSSDGAGLLWVGSRGGPLARLPGPLIAAGNEVLNRFTALRSPYTDVHAAARKLERFGPRPIAFVRKQTPAQLARKVPNPADGSMSTVYERLRGLYVEHLQEHADDLSSAAQ